jgi:dolichol kinase
MDDRHARHDGGAAVRWRERVEFERRIVHAAGALYVAPYLLGWLSWGGTRALLVAGLIVVSLLEFLRLVVGLDHAIYRTLTRPYERESVAGYALYQASMTCVGLWFAPAIAIPAMWMLALGDPVSGVLGRNAADECKRPRVWIATFLVCVAVALPITVPAFGPVTGAAAAVVGGFAAAVADGLPPVIRGRAVDDNLTIPILAAAGIWAVVSVLG